MRKNAGFTLMEVLVALAITGITTTFMSRVFAEQVKYNTLSEFKSIAQNVGDRRIDELRITDPNTLPSSGSVTSTIAAAGRNFTVKTEYCKSPGYCSTSMRHIVVTVSYRGTNYYDTETVFTQLR